MQGLDKLEATAPTKAGVGTADTGSTLRATLEQPCPVVDTKLLTRGGGYGPGTFWTEAVAQVVICCLNTDRTCHDFLQPPLEPQDAAGLVR